MDVAGGTLRKQGPGMMQADLLVINKADLATRRRESRCHGTRRERTAHMAPLIFTDCRHGDGIEAVATAGRKEELRAAGVTPQAVHAR